MSDSNTKNLKLKIIQDHLELTSGNVLLCSNDSVDIDLLSNENLQVFPSTNQSISDHIDNLLLTKTFHKDLSKYNQKFGTIIIHNLLEQIKYPELFLQNLVSILDGKGTIICSISNFFHITNIINLLVGNLYNEFFSPTRFYDLDKFLFFLNENNMHVTKVFRIKEEFLPQQTNLDEIVIPSKLIDIIQKIPDYDTLQYIFMINKGKSIPNENLEFASQFPKNYLLPKLQEFFEKFSELEKSIADKNEIIHGLENSIKDITGHTGSALAKKDKVIAGYADSMKEQKTYTGSALAKKDKVIVGYADSIKEQKAYTGSALAKKDKVIAGYKNSIKEQKAYTELALAKKDKVIAGYEDSIKEQKTLIAGYRNSIKEQKTLIAGYRNSIKEQQEFIKNLDEHIRNLESKLKKFAFWKK